MEGGAKTYESESLGLINAGAVTTFSQFSLVSERSKLIPTLNIGFLTILKMDFLDLDHCTDGPIIQMVSRTLFPTIMCVIIFLP